MKSRIPLISICLFMAGIAAAQTPTTAADAASTETAARRDERMRWWRDARFGMFIHWGLYAIPAGEWKNAEGQTAQVRGIGEWIMDRANIPVDDYKQLAVQFNPTKYDPAAWARAAKNAGMKYLVITSKHHDGFCLWDTATTDFDVVDATPYGKDLLAPLAAACEAEGVRFCLYYSIMDWTHPSQERFDETKYSPTRMKEGRKQEYLDYMQAQLTELVTKFKPGVLWFDGEWPDWYTPEDGHKLYAYLMSLDPNLIINNRIGKGRRGMAGMDAEGLRFAGDFGTPEQRIPPTGLPGVDWESCMTMNDTWGFKKNDENWKSAQTLIRNLVDVSSKGGNYLLNVGPTAEGEIPPPSLERLGQMGEWLQSYGEAIYGTQASPFKNLPAWGRVTQRPLDGMTKLYLFLFGVPANGRISLPLANEPQRAYILGKPESARQVTHDTPTTVTFQVPETTLDSNAEVFVMEIIGKPLPTE